MTTTAAFEFEHIYVKTNGITLHTVQAGDPSGEPIILLHGFPEFWYGWKRQIEFLAGAGYRVIAPDQRGYNLSDKPAEVSAYRMKQLVADVIGLIDSVGRDKINLVGHDWGGAVAWSTAIRHPDRVKKLAIINSPHPTVFLRIYRSNPKQMLRSGYMLLFQLPKLPEAALMRGGGKGAKGMLKNYSRPNTFTDAEIEVYKEAWSQPGAMTAMLNWYRATGRRPASTISAASKTAENSNAGAGKIAATHDFRVHVPTLIIWGKNDVAFEKDVAQPSVEMCDDGRLVTFDDAGHWIAHEKPDDVNRLLAGHFR